MSDTFKPGDKAGYVIVVLDRFNPSNWYETPSGIIDTMTQAVAMVKAYEDMQRGAEHKDTYAVGKVTLSMISRPS